MTTAPLFIGLTGFAQTGKDTAAGYLRDIYAYEQRAFADALRTLAGRLNPTLPCGFSYNEALETWGYEKSKSGVSGFREYLKDLGNGVRDVVGKDAWVNAAFNGVGHRSTFSDVRFLNEADAVRENAARWGRRGIVVRIERPGYGPESDFEREVNLITPDFTVYNDGTPAHLFEQLAELMAKAAR